MFDFDAATEALLCEWYDLHRIHSHSRMREISRGEMFVLNFLAGSEQPVQPRELSVQMQASTARIAAILNRLEHKGLAQRCGDPHDRRRTLVTITAAGRRHIEQEKQTIFTAVRHILQSLGEKDSAECIRLLGRIIEIAAEQHTPPTLPVLDSKRHPRHARRGNSS